MEPVIITCDLVGGELTKKDTPFLPVTPQEIAQEALAAAREGASVMHLHARDAHGVPKHDPKIFQEIVDNIKSLFIREKIDLPILQFSTGGSCGMQVNERVAPLALQPEMASLTLGTVNFGRDVFLNDQATMEGIATVLKQRNIAVELEIFDAGMIDNVVPLLKKGLLVEPLHFNFVLGVPGGLGGDVANLLFLKTRIEAYLARGSTWSVAGIGRHQLPLAMVALAAGGHVRVGLEDNIFLNKGELSKGNAPLVARIKHLAALQGRTVASAEQARKALVRQ